MEMKVQVAETGPEAPATAQPAAAPVERPVWLPEKFQSPEAMAAAYAELEKKLGAGEKPAEETAKAPEEKPAEGTETPPTEGEVKEAVEKAGLDFAAVEAEFLEKGVLSEETFAALEKSGIPRKMAESYIAGQVALAESIKTRISSLITGGEEALPVMIEWAKTNMSKAEIAAYNKAIDSGDEGQITVALRGLNAAYTQANGSPSKLLNGGTAGPSGDVFRSAQEVVRAMSDPRYARDEAYRNDVAAKLARSNVFG